MAARNYPWKRSIKMALGESEEALRCQDIAEIIQERGYRRDFGATPAQTVASVIHTSIRRDAENSPFRKVGRGLFSLKEDVTKIAKTETAPDIEEADRELIRAFGILWRRDWINWGTRRLMGSQLDSSSKVDFADQSGVYILYDRDRPIYVGRCPENSLFDRLKSHTTGRFSSRWERFSWFGFRGPDDAGKLEHVPADHSHENAVEAMEAVLIEVLEPPQNRRRGDKLSEFEFNQVRDDEMEQRRAKQLILQQLGLS